MRENPISPSFFKPNRESAETRDPRSDQPSFLKASDNRGPEIRVQFRFLDGHRQALSYSYLIDLTIDPARGIQLVFTNQTIQIRGRRLMPLFDLLSDHRIKWVEEIDTVDAANVRDGGTIVTAIHVNDGVQSSAPVHREPVT